MVDVVVVGPHAVVLPDDIEVVMTCKFVGIHISAVDDRDEHALASKACLMNFTAVEHVELDSPAAIEIAGGLFPKCIFVDVVGKHHGRGVGSLEYANGAFDVG